MEEIITELSYLIKCSDVEYAHSKADDLLIEFISKLQLHYEDNDIRNKIIELYKLVPKWYA